MSWFSEQPDGVVLNLKVTPRASRDAIGEPLGDALKIKLQAPPVDGKANKALCKLLAKRLGVSNRAVTILSGDTARTKRIEIRGVTGAELEARLKRDD